MHDCSGFNRRPISSLPSPSLAPLPALSLPFPGGTVGVPLGADFYARMFVPGSALRTVYFIQALVHTGVGTFAWLPLEPLSQTGHRHTLGPERPEQREEFRTTSRSERCRHPPPPLETGWRGGGVVVCGLWGSHQIS